MNAPDSVRGRWDEAFLIPGPRKQKRLLKTLITWHDRRRERMPLEIAILVVIAVALFVVIGTWGIVLALLLFVSRELVLGILIELLVVLILRKVRVER